MITTSFLIRDPYLPLLARIKPKEVADSQLKKKKCSRDMASSGAQSLGLRLQDRLLLAVDRELTISRVTFLVAAFRRPKLCLHRKRPVLPTAERRRRRLGALLTLMRATELACPLFLDAGLDSAVKAFVSNNETVHGVLEQSMQASLRASPGSHSRCHQ